MARLAVATARGPGIVGTKALGRHQNVMFTALPGTAGTAESVLPSVRLRRPPARLAAGGDVPIGTHKALTISGAPVTAREPTPVGPCVIWLT